MRVADESGVLAVLERLHASADIDAINAIGHQALMAWATGMALKVWAAAVARPKIGAVTAADPRCAAQPCKGARTP